MKKLDSILLIDDDPISNFLTERLLLKMQVSDDVKIALNGIQALQMIEDHCKDGNPCPALILLDINMPVMSGIDFLHLFQQKNFNGSDTADIIVLSTSTHHKDQKQINELGVKHILQKPLTEAKLQQVWEETGRM
jgi:CheY-like chemotaxis protein